jgi:hypothetical protein
MPKIPIQPIIKVAKTAAPKVIDFVKKDPKTAAGLGGTVIKVGKELLDTKENRFEKKQRNGKVHYRKTQHSKYYIEILPKLDSYSYIQLNSYKQEIENFIKQIHQEEANQLVINKPLHSKRSKSWRQIQIQIEDKMKTKNYEELLKAYNSPSYESNYFDAKVINDMRNIENKNELYKYIHRYTERDMKDIERDFF